MRHPAPRLQSPSQPDNYRYCTEMDIFAEGQAFDLSVAQIEGCTDISVWNMNMEDEGVFALAKAMALQSPQVITKLDLGYNKVCMRHVPNPTRLWTTRRQAASSVTTAVSAGRLSPPSR